MGKIEEHDAMTCNACGNEERASEGYPCRNCGRFICIMCDIRGVTLCRDCQAKQPNVKPAPLAPKPTR